MTSTWATRKRYRATSRTTQLASIIAMDRESLRIWGTGELMAMEMTTTQRMQMARLVTTY